MGPKGIIGVSIKRGFSQPGQDTRPPPIESGPGRRKRSPQRTETIPEALWASPRRRNRKSTIDEEGQDAEAGQFDRAGDGRAFLFAQVAEKYPTPIEGRAGEP